MRCLYGCLALTTPRLVVLALFLFTDYLGTAYESNLWPFLGFFFLPCTTLSYAIAMNENGGQLSGWFVALFILALALDFGVVRFGRWGRRPPPPPSGNEGEGGGGRSAPTAPRSIEVHGERVG